MKTVFTTIIVLILALQCSAWHKGGINKFSNLQNDRESGGTTPQSASSPLTLNAPNGTDSASRSHNLNVASPEKSIANYFSFQISPEQDKVFISGGEHYFTRIEVTNAAGNMVLFTNDKDSDVLLNFSRFSKGKYAIKIFTENGTITKTFNRK